MPSFESCTRPATKQLNNVELEMVSASTIRAEERVNRP